MNKYAVITLALIATASPANAFEPKIVVPPCVEQRHAHLQPQFPVCGTEAAQEALARQRRAYTPLTVEVETVCDALGDCLTRQYKVWSRE